MSYFVTIFYYHIPYKHWYIFWRNSRYLKWSKTKGRTSPEMAATTMAFHTDGQFAPTIRTGIPLENCSGEAVAVISQKVLEQHKGDATEPDFQVTFPWFPWTRPEGPDGPLEVRLLLAESRLRKVHLSSIPKRTYRCKTISLLRCRPLCLGPQFHWETSLFRS